MSGSGQQSVNVTSVRVLDSPAADNVRWLSDRVATRHRSGSVYDVLFQGRSEATRPRITINHPMANRISVQNHGGAYAGTTTSELAFFRDDEWVVEPIPEFAEYHDGSPKYADLAVYGWVPNDLVLEFLEKYGTSR